MSLTRQGIGMGGAAAALLALAPGCATVMHGTKQAVAINTVPAGAFVDVDGQRLQTPCAPRLARSKDHTLVVSMPGYRTEKCHVARMPTRAILGNIWAGGLIGMGVDAATGANNKLVPECFELVLVAEPAKPEELTAITVSASDVPGR